MASSIVGNESTLNENNIQEKNIKEVNFMKFMNLLISTFKIICKQIIVKMQKFI